MTQDQPMATAAPGEQAAAPAGQSATSGILDQLGMGGARPYLRAGAAGLKASANAPNFLSALGLGFAGAQDAYAASDAAAAKQAREDAEIKRKQANEDREFGLQSKREERQARQDEQENAARQEELSFKREERQRLKEYRESGGEAQDEADKKLAARAKLELDPEKFGTQDELEAAVDKLRNQEYRKAGLGGGSATFEDPLVPSSKYPSRARQQMLDGLNKDGSYARAMVNGKMTLLRSEGGKWKPVDVEAEKKAREAAPADTGSWWNPFS